MTIYIVAAVLFFAFGLLSYRFWWWGLIGILVAPTGSSYAAFNYNFGLYIHDFYFFGLAIIVLLKRIQQQKLLRVNIYIGGMFLCIGLYAMVYKLQGGKVDVYFLRDLRPLLLIMQIGLLFELNRVTAPKDISIQKILFTIMLSSASTIVWQGLHFSGMISSLDVYYEDNSFRYFDLSTYFTIVVVVYFFWRVYSRGRIRFISENSSKEIKLIAWFVVVVSIFVLIISGYRMILFSALLAIAIVASTSVKRSISVVLVVGVLSGLFLLISTLMKVERVTQSLDLAGLTSQFSIRYMPAFERISEMSGSDFLFGLGYSTTFEIPWFTYRGLNERNNQLDSAYLTFYVKYGLLGLVMLYIYIKLFISMIGTSGRLLVAGYVAMFLMLYLVFSVPYQSAGLGLYIGSFFVRKLQTQRI